MILRLEIITAVVTYERKIISFYEKNLKLMKDNTFNVFKIVKRILFEIITIFKDFILCF